MSESLQKKTAPWPELKRPLVAILRGIKPAEAVDIAGALVEAGFEAIEVPLNSPDPFASIAKMVDAFSDRCLIGAGTVLSPDDVKELAAVGGKLMVSPNIDSGVMQQAAVEKLVTMPGVFSASEAISAVKLGASALKFFPASVLGSDGIKAVRAVLPPDCVIGAVGGVGHDDFKNYMKAGVTAFGLGSSLYKPGLTSKEVVHQALITIDAYDQAVDAV
ncbi:MAG: 2-dehydro-3-deoxy-6-phosphogalactonate aldolase [Pseudomonadota bacterium]